MTGNAVMQARRLGVHETAHYLGRHGPSVTPAQLIARATKGIDPITGLARMFKNGKPRLVDATRFNTYDDMLSAIEKAHRAFRAEYGAGRFASKPVGVTIDMLRPIGEGYAKKTGVFKAGLTRVYVLFNEAGQAITAYPIYKDLVR